MKTSGDEGLALEIIKGEFVVCTLNDASSVLLDAPYCFFAKTPEEISLVCLRDHVPAETEKADGGWRGFRVAGQLDFSLVGILARLSTILAEKGISIFAVSTYDTDYILVRQQLLKQAAEALREQGYTVNGL